MVAKRSLSRRTPARPPARPAYPHLQSRLVAEEAERARKKRLQLLLDEADAQKRERRLREANEVKRAALLAAEQERAARRQRDQERQLTDPLRSTAQDEGADQLTRPGEGWSMAGFDAPRLNWQTQAPAYTHTEEEGPPAHDTPGADLEPLQPELSLAPVLAAYCKGRVKGGVGAFLQPQDWPVGRFFRHGQGHGQGHEQNADAGPAAEQSRRRVAARLFPLGSPSLGNLVAEQEVQESSDEDEEAGWWVGGWLGGCGWWGAE